MKRLLLMLGAVLSMTGVVGLAVYGGSIVGALADVLIYRIVNPPQPLPASVAQLGSTALSGTAFVFGLVVVCLGTVMRDGQKLISPRGKVLLAVAGLLFLLGAMSLLTGIVGAKAGFRVIAMSAATPKPEMAREMAQNASPAFRIGSGFLIAGAVILLVTGQVGLQTKPLHANEARSVLGGFAAVTTVVLAIVSSFLFVGLWFHGYALEAFLTSSGATPKPHELAQHLTGILNNSLVAYICVACQGAMLVVAAVSAPLPSSETVSKGIK